MEISLERKEQRYVEISEYSEATVKLRKAVKEMVKSQQNGRDGRTRELLRAARKCANESDFFRNHVGNPSNDYGQFARQLKDFHDRFGHERKKTRKRASEGTERLSDMMDEVCDLSDKA